MTSDTIAALSTPNGESAIAAIRLSGGMCLETAKSCFGKSEISPRFASHSSYVSKDGKILDDVVFTFFKAPNSYTGEDMLEICTHGNPYIVQTVLEDLFARGVRAATHGEFTRRAFENHKLDLSQAEAVALMIAARSEKSLEAARKQLGGELSKRVNSMCDTLIEALAYMEAYIDFSDEDLPKESFSKPKELLEKFVCDASRLVSTSRYGAVLRDGLNVSIIGEPNAGKSSLMNCVLGRNRAIVSPSAGTTRDFIVERFSIGGYCVNLADTAGLRTSGDEIETEGIRRALEVAKDSDLKLLVLDVSENFGGVFEIAKSFISPSNTIVVLNKIDKPRAQNAGIFKDFVSVEVSCLEDRGIENLKEKILEFITKNSITSSFDDILVSARHSGLVADSLENAKSALEKIDSSAPSELVASDIRAALDSLGEIVGRGDREEVLSKIFSTFCIGK